MFKYFTANSTRKYVDILDKQVDRYNNCLLYSILMSLFDVNFVIFSLRATILINLNLNLNLNTVHSSIGMTPKEASEKKNEVKVWRNLYGNYTPQKRMTPKFKVGDKVRITRKESLRKVIPRDGLKKSSQFQKSVTPTR